MGDGQGPVIATKPSNRKKIIGVVVACLLAAVLIAAAVLAFGTNALTPSHPTPKFVQQTLAEAKSAAAKDHFTLHIEPGVKSITLGTGIIVSQSPAPGKLLKQGSTVNVVPSIGKPNVSVPSLTGLNCTQAAAALSGVHLVAHCVPPQYNDTIANTIIISWSQGNVQEPTTAPYGSVITIIPSEGHSLVQVPTIPSSYTFGEAQAALQVANFTAVQATATSNTVPAGNVISTSPASGTMAPYQSNVTVTISSGPPTVQVPNVFGDTVSEADSALTAQGLVVSGVTGNPNRLVVGTNPQQGTTVDVGTSVQIITN
jgi:beta-lactam-binding protein with PASTA domain